jgi:hypothetical protein
MGRKMRPRLTIGIGAGLGLASSAMIQLTDINRLFLLAVFGLGVFIVVWELAPFIAGLISPGAGRNRTMLPVLVMALGVVAFGAGAVWYYVEHPKVTTPPLIGGRGGDVSIEGNRSGGVGGDAGQSGLWPGGRGGDVNIKGDDAYGRGGAGGGSPMPDGRGGRAAKGPMELENAETKFWKYGRGGMGGNLPEYNRRMALLTKIRQEYIQEFPGEKSFIDAGIDPVPINWVNKRLEEMGETWRVTIGDSGYVLPPLIEPQK